MANIYLHSAIYNAFPDSDGAEAAKYRLTMQLDAGDPEKGEVVENSNLDSIAKGFSNDFNQLSVFYRSLPENSYKISIIIKGLNNGEHALVSGKSNSSEQNHYYAALSAIGTLNNEQNLNAILACSKDDVVKKAVLDRL